MLNIDISVDNLRFIEGTNTQVRQLRILSALIKIIGNKQLPIDLLKTMALKWSAALEHNCENYNNSNGKLTERGIPTSAFTKYIELSESFGLTIKIGHTLSLSKYGSLLFAEINDKRDLDFSLSQYEKGFYLYLILKKDADIMFTLYDIISSSENFINQTNAQRKFKDAFLKRLSTKINYATPHVKVKLAEKKRVIQYDWLSAEKYSEHIIGPRLEWYTVLELLEKEKRGSSTFYSPTKQGRLFFKSMPVIEPFGLPEVNSFWFNNYVFHSLYKLLITKSASPFDKLKLFKKYLLEASMSFGSSNAFRIPIEVTFIYISLSMLINNYIILEFFEIEKWLNQKVEFQGKTFSLKTAARSNEGYITIKLNR